MKLSKHSGMLLLVVLATLVLSGGCMRSTPKECMQSTPKELIAQLVSENIYEVHFGTIQPVETNVVRAIVQYGDTAVPFLVDALSSQSPMQVGYAAYCLNLMGNYDHKPEAEAALHRFEAKPETEWAYFAIGALKNYLSEFKNYPLEEE